MSLDPVEYWAVQNTGWSNGISWFDVGGLRADPLRLTSEAEARDYIERNRGGDSATKWRIVHVRVERFENKRITTEEWVEA